MDSLFKEESPFSSMFIRDVTFHNYKKSYENISNCENNVVFKNHPKAASATAGHYLSRVACHNCEEDVLISLMDPL
jgi:benzoyl-CoA reductase/2-hydroxyglutaryl-CoA dehydratase subunit BcrC/BadD/HgdB